MLTLIDEPDSHNHPPEPDWHVLCYMRSNDDNTYDFWSVYESRGLRGGPQRYFRRDPPRTRDIRGCLLRHGRQNDFNRNRLGVR